MKVTIPMKVLFVVSKIPTYVVGVADESDWAVNTDKPPPPLTIATHCHLHSFPAGVLVSGTITNRLRRQPFSWPSVDVIPLEQVGLCPAPIGPNVPT